MYNMCGNLNKKCKIYIRAPASAAKIQRKVQNTRNEEYQKIR